MFYHTHLPPHLRILKDEIEGYAREYGLDFYETIFEVIDADDLNQIAAYGGFPTRYPHWSFGMAYEELKKGYDYGLSKIYEMVINNDPCYAYLMRCNHTMDQKLVIAHVYGHCDFFKNNAYFSHTNRKMMDEIANHGARIRRYAERFGEDEVEAFLDRCMSLDDLIDIHSTAIRRRGGSTRYDFAEPHDEEIHANRFKSKAYMDEYINPKAVLQAEEEKLKSHDRPQLSFPDHPEKDVLLFLIEHAPLSNWQKDVLSLVRDEAYYFTPQGQTKIINEGWACVQADTLLLTSEGLIPAHELVGSRREIAVHDGESPQEVYDWASFTDRETVWVKTRRGLELEGSTTHRVMLSDGSWRRLDEIKSGDTIRVARNTNLWPEQEVALHWKPQARLTLAGIAEQAGVDLKTVFRYREKLPLRANPKVTALLPQYEAERTTLSFNQNKRRKVRVPAIVSEAFGAFLGYLIGDGHISDRKRTIGMTSGDEPQADAFAALTEQLFGVAPRKKWDVSKWRILFSSQTIRDFLCSLGLATGVAARRKSIPAVILRSPKPVVAAFLRALYDCDGYAGKAGVILSTSSVRMSKEVQQVLLNFGIHATRRPHRDGCWHVQSMGQSAQRFREEIGFGLARKQLRLDEYVHHRQWFKEETDTDTITEIAFRRADVYDVSVRHTHRYVAQGFINHNSYWHSTMMTQKILQPSEFIDYADHHSGTMATNGKRLNPYKLGIELLRDIEQRWNTGRFGPEFDNCEDIEEKRRWNKNLGLGRQKIFEVRRIHNDITLIDTFLTPEFCVEHKLFSFAHVEQSGQYVIESREFDLVKKRLLFSLTNFGKPFIFVLNGNHRNRGELLLRHEYNGIPLKMQEAQDTLANIQFIWKRPVHLETVIDDKPTLLSFDGTEQTQKPIGETDESRRNAPAKTK